MATKYPQYLLSSPICDKGDKTIPPATSQEAGSGRLSQAEGFDKWTSTPIGKGGKPPKREDWNGAMFLLSNLLVWYQQGGVMEYSATFDYEPNNEVFHNSVKYRCLKANGASTLPVVPGTDKNYWKSLDAPSVLAGLVAPYYNCRVGGSDGRRLIPWGSDEALETYVLCDGGADGLGGKTPNLVDRFILPSLVNQAGQIGGSLKAMTDSKKISGTVGETVLTVEQMPAHTHTGSTSSAGSHSHGRGSMNITGSFQIGSFPLLTTNHTGAFFGSDIGLADNHGQDSVSNVPKATSFDASRSWTGYTSYDGTHDHTMNLNNTGGGKGHTHSLTGAAHDHAVTVDKPPYFKMAFFVKLPE